MRDGKKQIVILGGGFGGLYTALELEKRLGSNEGWRVLVKSCVCTKARPDPSLQMKST